MPSRLNYYFNASYRRKLLDSCLERNKELYRGSVLDIGGRDRGGFRKPKTEVTEWLFADINPDYHPDLVLDVTDMRDVPNERFDVINATELFEHVEYLEKGLSECYRALKPGGTFILSAPFLYPIHADPTDYQRWTKFKWQSELTRAGFEIETIKPMGYFFTVAMEMYKTFVHLIPTRLIRWPLFCTFPLADLISRLDAFETVKKGKLGNYTTGYFIVCRKQLPKT